MKGEKGDEDPLLLAQQIFVTERPFLPSRFWSPKGTPFSQKRNNTRITALNISYKENKDRF